MCLDDIPVLRHLVLFINTVKALAMLACLFLFPLMVVLKVLDFLEARTHVARWYFGLQAGGWFCSAMAYGLLMMAMLGNMFGYPAISEGRSWPFLLALFSDAQGIDLVLGEMLLQCGLSGLAFCLSWICGSTLEDGSFVPRTWLREE